METNGELRLIEAISSLSPTTVFDVGANEGEWSTFALDALPAASLTSFEPIPDVAARCHARLARFGDRSTVVPMGLAETSGPRPFFIDRDRTTVSGLSMPHTDMPLERLELPFTTGDEYCAKSGVGTIDLLKIDAEGADHLVLAGFSEMLGQRRIRIVQFEYGPWALSNRYLLADFVDSLGGFGYQVGRLYAEGVEFREHTPRFEDFRLANYVAVRRHDVEAIDAVRAL
jgi:FkbM family methyltransferase